MKLLGDEGHSSRLGWHNHSKQFLTPSHACAHICIIYFHDKNASHLHSTMSHASLWGLAAGYLPTLFVRDAPRGRGRWGHQHRCGFAARPRGGKRWVAGVGEGSYGHIPADAGYTIYKLFGTTRVTALKRIAWPIYTLKESTISIGKRLPAIMIW